MASHSLTEYEAYCLDVSGYIVLPSVLTAAELAAVRQACCTASDDASGLSGKPPVAAAIAALGAHPTLERYANVVMSPAKLVWEADEASGGGGLATQFKPDGAPHILADTGGAAETHSECQERTQLHLHY